MPNGKKHKKLYVKYSPILLIPVLISLVFGNWYFALFIIVGYGLHAGGLTPDLDLIGINADEALWIKSVIFIPLVAWSALYARMVQGFGGHRGFLSHSLIISSAIRLLWFGFPFIVAFRYLFIDPIYVEFIAMGIGLSIADAIHILADRFYKKG